MARISTHVLDLATGKPAAGIGVHLFCNGQCIAAAVTNLDGRTDAPLVAAEAIPTGAYRIEFQTRAYQGPSAFFDDVSIAFHVTDGNTSCHVPLLLSPFGYSTYRGS